LGGSCANAANGVSAATSRKPRKQWVGDMDTSWVKANTGRTRLAQLGARAHCATLLRGKASFERSIDAGMILRYAFKRLLCATSR